MLRKVGNLVSSGTSIGRVGKIHVSSTNRKRTRRPIARCPLMTAKGKAKATQTKSSVLRVVLSLSLLLVLFSWQGVEGEPIAVENADQREREQETAIPIPATAASNEMICERRDVDSGSGSGPEKRGHNPKSTAIFCTFRVDVDGNAEHEGEIGNENEDANSKRDTGGGGIAFRSCVSSDSDGGNDNDGASEDCVTASVSFSKGRRFIPKESPEGESESILELKKPEEKPSTPRAAEQKTEPKTSESETAAHQQQDQQQQEYQHAGPIVVGQATYRPPYREQYGSAVGEILLEFHTLGVRAGSLDANEATLDLVGWCLALGHAHMDDADFGVQFDGDVAGQKYSSHASHPQNYHIELALKAYEWSSSALSKMASNSNTNGISDYLFSTSGGAKARTIEEGDRDAMVMLQYHAIIEFAKGEAYTVAMAAEENTAGYSYASTSTSSSTSDDETFQAGAVSSYRRAQTSYETLRYLYAKLAADAEKREGRDFMERTLDAAYFNKERYYTIEMYYANSCFQLAMGLYSQLIMNQNAEVLRSNEKVMEVMKSQYGLQADASDDEIVAALMDQANGGNGNGGGGGGGAGGGASSSFAHSFDASGMGLDLGLDDLGDLLGGIGEGDSEEKNAQLVEITALLDTAILTYQQHANAIDNANTNANIEESNWSLKLRPNPKNPDQHQKMNVYVNGVLRKSTDELEEEERLFHWQASLATAYQNAAVIATYRNQHIRSRELTTHSLNLYTDVILPYYDEKEIRGKKTTNGQSQSGGTSYRHRSRGALGTEPTSQSHSQNQHPISLSAMTREYAEVSAGHLYVTLADTAMKLGGYEDSKQSYERAMDWHQKHYLMPAQDGIFNSLSGDEVSIRQYDDFATTYRQELDQYHRDLKAGYVYKDDSYEAQMILTIAPLYMAMGQSKPAIRYYREAIAVYERFVTNDLDLTDTAHKMAFLNLADARLGLATAYFHSRRFPESKEQYVLSCDAYQTVYGEGTPPQPEDEAEIEVMKDSIIESYGQEYYEQLKAHYDRSGGANGNVNGNTNDNDNRNDNNNNNGNGNGLDNNNGNNNGNQRVATNFDVLGYHNETLDDSEPQDTNVAGGDADSSSQGDDEL